MSATAFRISLAQMVWSVSALLAAFSAFDQANAVPSYARQTGLACEACHTVFPQLTPFGRVFKASGYTLFNTGKVQDINRLERSTLSLSDVPPISVMAIVATSVTSKANDAQSTNTVTDFPDQLSVFYAGHIADNLGAYIQATYSSQSGTFGIDNTDIRYADVVDLYDHSVIFGLSLNNNPTVQDLWNSTPAWGGPPFVGNPNLLTPVATPQIEGKLAQLVGGLSAYAFIDQSIYLEAGVYRSALQGISVASNGNNANNVTSSVAPYWRLAYERDWGSNSWEIGTFGLNPRLRNPTTPAGGALNISLQNAPADRFLDVGVDSQYQYITDDIQVAATARWTHENQNLNASNPALNSDNWFNHLNFETVSGSFYWRRKWGASVNFFNLSGSRDFTYLGTADGKPDSNGGNFEVDYVPWLNVKLGVQYTVYFKFNGRTTNYDGAGRNASNNNTLFAFLWVSF